MTSKRPLIVLVVVFVFAALTISAIVRSDRAKEWKKVLDAAKISLVDGIKKAEKETGGKAVGAEMEMEGGKVTMDVIILKGGEKPELLEVEVSGETGAILETEAYESEDKDSEGDDDKDDDDKDDDDDDDHEDDD